MKGEKVIKAYKGFKKDLTCRGFQYEIGKEYEHDGEIVICSQGFHACENPFDVLYYYSDIDGRYCEVEQSGNVVKSNGKTASSKIKIKAEIGFVGLFKAGIEWLKEVTSPYAIINDTNNSQSATNDNGGDSAKIGSSGDYAQIGSSGDSAKIGSSGDYAKIGSSGDYAQIGSSGDYAQIGSSGDSAKIGSSGDSAKIGSSGYSAKIGSSGDSAKIGSSGDYAQIESTGEDTVICCAGHASAVKAKQGSWITLAEWRYDKKRDRNVPACVKTEYVDGKRIKADTWYQLVNGDFQEVANND